MSESVSLYTELRVLNVFVDCGSRPRENQEAPSRSWNNLSAGSLRVHVCTGLCNAFSDVGCELAHVSFFKLSLQFDRYNVSYTNRLKLHVLSAFFLSAPYPYMKRFTNWPQAFLGIRF